MPDKPASPALAPLRILLLADDRPGHYHLSDGIVAAIARRRPVDVHRIEVKRRALLPTRLTAVLANIGLSPALMLRAAYGLAARDLGAFDLVVSAGGNTLAANVAAARLRRAPNIFYGSLRRFRPELFSIAFTSYERDARHDRIVATIKPSALDPDKVPLPAPRPVASAADVASAGDVTTAASDNADRRGAHPTFALLIGGNAGDMRFSADDWQQLLAFIEAMHRETGTRFAVSNSRRTPADVSDTLAAAAARKGGAIADFVDVRSAGPGTLGRVFAASEVVLVTTDSSSMLSEAIWLKRPAIAITPAHDALDEAERRYRQRLMDRGLTRTIPIAELTPRTLSAALADLTPLDGNPLDELAGIIAERIPGLFSP